MIIAYRHQDRDGRVQHLGQPRGISPASLGAAAAAVREPEPVQVMGQLAQV
jgi:hypothetical protein